MFVVPVDARAASAGDRARVSPCGPDEQPAGLVSRGGGRDGGARRARVVRGEGVMDESAARCCGGDARQCKQVQGARAAKRHTKNTGNMGRLLVGTME